MVFFILCCRSLIRWIKGEESCDAFLFYFMMIFDVSAAIRCYYADEKERERSCCVVLAYDMFI